MTLVRRLARIAGLAFSRTAQRLLVWAAEKRDAETLAGPEAPRTDSTDGPPAHWLEAIRARAPWLLAGQRFSQRGPVLRPLVPRASCDPEQTPAPGRELAPDRRRANVVYKEGDRGNATPKLEERTPPEPIRPRSPTPRRAPLKPAERSSLPESRDQSHPQSRIGKPEKPAGSRPPSPGISAAFPLAEGWGDSAPTILQATVPLTAPEQTRSSPPAHQVPPAGPPERRPTQSVPAEPRRGHAPSVFQDGPSEARPSLRPHQAESSGRAERNPTESARTEERSRPSIRFHPVQWGERGREYPAQPERPADSANEMVEDPWPQLPEWGWQQWQMDPIQRQFQEWDRRGRLKAEQAGSSWSGPHS
jgi:hypothetical protein